MVLLADLVFSLPQVNGFEFHGDPIDGGALSALWLLPDLPAEAKH